jgi:hypothetical protein
MRIHASRHSQDQHTYLYTRILTYIHTYIQAYCEHWKVKIRGKGIEIAGMENWDDGTLNFIEKWKSMADERERERARVEAKRAADAVRLQQEQVHICVYVYVYLFNS